MDEDDLPIPSHDHPDIDVDEMTLLKQEIMDIKKRSHEDAMIISSLRIALEGRVSHLDRVRNTLYKELVSMREHMYQQALSQQAQQGAASYLPDFVVSLEYMTELCNREFFLAQEGDHGGSTVNDQVILALEQLNNAKKQALKLKLSLEKRHREAIAKKQLELDQMNRKIELIHSQAQETIATIRRHCNEKMEENKSRAEGELARVTAELSSERRRFQSFIEQAKRKQEQLLHVMKVKLKDRDDHIKVISNMVVQKEKETAFVRSQMLRTKAVLSGIFANAKKQQQSKSNTPNASVPPTRSSSPSKKDRPPALSVTLDGGLPNNVPPPHHHTTPTPSAPSTPAPPAPKATPTAVAGAAELKSTLAEFNVGPPKSGTPKNSAPAPPPLKTPKATTPASGSNAGNGNATTKKLKEALLLKLAAANNNSNTTAESNGREGVVGGEGAGAALLLSPTANKGGGGGGGGGASEQHHHQDQPVESEPPPQTLAEVLDKLGLRRDADGNFINDPVRENAEVNEVVGSLDLFAAPHVVSQNATTTAGVEGAASGDSVAFVEGSTMVMIGGEQVDMSGAHDILHSLDETLKGIDPISEEDLKSPPSESILLRRELLKKQTQCNELEASLARMLDENRSLEMRMVRIERETECRETQTDEMTFESRCGAENENSVEVENVGLEEFSNSAESGEQQKQQEEGECDHHGDLAEEGIEAENDETAVDGEQEGDDHGANSASPKRHSNNRKSITFVQSDEQPSSEQQQQEGVEVEVESAPSVETTQNEVGEKVDGDEGEECDHEKQREREEEELLLRQQKQREEQEQQAEAERIKLEQQEASERALRENMAALDTRISKLDQWHSTSDPEPEPETHDQISSTLSVEVENSAPPSVLAPAPSAVAPPAPRPPIIPPSPINGNQSPAIRGGRFMTPMLDQDSAPSSPLVSGASGGISLLSPKSLLLSSGVAPPPLSPRPPTAPRLRPTLQSGGVQTDHVGDLFPTPLPPAPLDISPDSKYFEFDEFREPPTPQDKALFVLSQIEKSFVEMTQEDQRAFVERARGALSVLFGAFVAFGGGGGGGASRRGGRPLLNSSSRRRNLMNEYVHTQSCDDLTAFKSNAKSNAALGDESNGNKMPTDGEEDEYDDDGSMMPEAALSEPRGHSSSPDSEIMHIVRRFKKRKSRKSVTAAAAANQNRSESPPPLEYFLSTLTRRRDFLGFSKATTVFAPAASAPRGGGATSVATAAAPQNATGTTRLKRLDVVNNAPESEQVRKDFPLQIIPSVLLPRDLSPQPSPSSPDLIPPLSLDHQNTTTTTAFIKPRAPSPRTLKLPLPLINPNANQSQQRLPILLPPLPTQRGGFRNESQSPILKESPNFVLYEVDPSWITNGTPPNASTYSALMLPKPPPPKPPQTAAAGDGFASPGRTFRPPKETPRLMPVIPLQEPERRPSFTVYGMKDKEKKIGAPAQSVGI